MMNLVLKQYLNWNTLWKIRDGQFEPPISSTKNYRFLKEFSLII